MGRRGPKPAAPELKILRGERASRRNPLAPPATGTPDGPPGHLDDVGRAEWHRLVAELGPGPKGAGVLARSDRCALEILCAAYARWIAARDLLAERGLTIPTPEGSHKSNPAHAIAAAAETTMIKLLGEFGATPSARNRVQAAPEAVPDALQQFLESRKD
jgi:P27 family predicted phage terminase small subunit